MFTKAGRLQEVRRVAAPPLFRGGKEDVEETRRLRDAQPRDYVIPGLLTINGLVT